MAKVTQLKEVVSEFDQPREMSEVQRSGEIPHTEQLVLMEQGDVPSAPPESDQPDKAVSATGEPDEGMGACSDTTTVTADTQPLVVDTEPAADGEQASQDRKKYRKMPQPEAEPQRELDHPHQPAASSEANSETGSHSGLVLHQAGEPKPSQSPKEQQEMRQFKIFVIGKTGTGKSSLCNKIVGRDDFPTGRSFNPLTKETKAAKTVRSGMDIIVVDTPDISSESKTKQKEMVDSWKRLTEGFTYMVVLAVRCDQRYSPAEYDVYRQIRDWWRHGLCRRLVVAFTFADTREDPSVDMAEELKTVWPELKRVIKDANNRYVVFSNEAGNTDDTPVAQLVNQIKRPRQELSTAQKFLIGILLCLVLLTFVYLVFILVLIDPFRAIMSLMIW